MPTLIRHKQRLELTGTDSTALYFLAGSVVWREHYFNCEKNEARKQIHFGVTLRYIAEIIRVKNSSRCWCFSHSSENFLVS